MADFVCTNVSQLNTAMSNATQGDRILVRGPGGGGSTGYYQTTNDLGSGPSNRSAGGFSFGHSGTSGSRITLMRYPGDAQPTLANRPSGSSAYFAFPTITFGGNDYCTVDGLKIDGSVFMFDTGSYSGSTTMSGGGIGNWVTNNEIIEGWETIASGGDGNWSGVRVEWQRDAIIRNNYIHDINATGNCNNQSSMCGVKLFSGHTALVEYNSIKNVLGTSQRGGIDDKQDSFFNTHRYNWIENVGACPLGGNQQSSPSAPAGTGTQWYGNVCICGDADSAHMFKWESGPMNDQQIYNNTCYIGTQTIVIPDDVDGGLVLAQGDAQDGLKLFNNIYYITNVSGSFPSNMSCYANIFTGGGLCDYNHYHRTTSQWRSGGTVTSSLATWQAAGFDTSGHVTSGDPLFTTNGSNFHLGGSSPCLGTGRTGGTSGGSAVDKGAYFNGITSVGHGAAAPQNFRLGV